MNFSAVVTLQYDTIFSAFSVQDWKKGLDWMQQSGLDGAELCISHYNDIDIYAVKEELDQRGLGSTHNADSDLAQLREAMLPIAEYARKKEVTVILEPINRYETILLNSGEEVYDFIVNDLGNLTGNPHAAQRLAKASLH